MKIPFLKMQGIGNDFIVISDLGDGMSRPDLSPDLNPITPELAKKLCDRRYGIGADQILWLKPHPSASCRMEILNADGSTAEMCGNGIRAVGIYLNRHGPTPGKESYHVDTPAGLKTVDILSDGPGNSPRASSVRVDMGAPGFGPKALSGGEPLKVDGKTLEFFEVSMGNPHAVFFVDQVSSFPVEAFGPLIENHPRFPHRTNVEFVQVRGSKEIQVRVWERGAGITLACGTGACASAVATLATQRAQGPLLVQLPGGELTIDWAGVNQPVWMSGPAEEVFRGEVEL